jgi:hypothetical protein
MSEPATPVAIGPRPLHLRPLHPRHGVHAPRTSLLARRPGSVRRSITIDTVRPGAILGETIQLAVGRDLLTRSDGTTEVLGVIDVRTRLDYADHYRLTELRANPGPVELQQLVGASVSTGFRAAMTAAAPQQQAEATLLHALLDDLPGAALVSGYAIQHANASPVRKPGAPVLQIEGLCAGFQRGGTIMEQVDADAPIPAVTGPEAPSLIDPDDPLAWHELRPMGAHDMRRWRRLDVMPGPTPDALVEVEAYFRDSHMDELGRETVIHEYTVKVVVDPKTQTIVGSDAVAHSLPWVECIEAEASGDRLAGLPLGGLRPLVRQDFVGVSTCTHLNDTMRSIEDVRALLAVL